MYGLTEIQLMNNGDEAIVKRRSAPRNVRFEAIALRHACGILGYQVVGALDHNLNPPITEGERQARQEGE